MIAHQHAREGPPPRNVEKYEIDAGLPQPGSIRLFEADRADGVEQYPHPDAAGRRPPERIDEPVGDPSRFHQIKLGQYVVPARIDRGQHPCKEFPAVGEQLEAVALAHRPIYQGMTIRRRPPRAAEDESEASRHIRNPPMKAKSLLPSRAFLGSDFSLRALPPPMTT